MAEITRDEIADIMLAHVKTKSERLDGETYTTILGINDAADAILAWLGDGWRPFSDALKCETVDPILVYREDAGKFFAAWAEMEECQDGGCWFSITGEDLTNEPPSHFFDVDFLTSPPKEGA